MIYWLQSVVGVVGLIGLAWLMSEDRKAMPVRWVLTALCLQIVLAVAILKVDFIWSALSLLSRATEQSDEKVRDNVVMC